MPLIRLLLLFTAAYALAVGPSAAAEVETERMTWVEIRDAVASGKTTIIIPTGGTEQNGAHMVTGKHNVIVHETARRIAARLGNALVAPVMAYVPEGDIGKAEGHMAFPGTISIAPDVFARVLEGAAHSFAIHGFKLIVFLGDSGSNQEPQRQLATDLSRRWAADGVRVINADAYYSENGGFEWLLAAGESEQAIGSHAAVRDTSELLAVDPEGVRNDKRAADSNGVVGDPRLATAERGEKLLALKVEAAVNEIRSVETATSAPSAAAPSLWKRLWGYFFG